MAVSEVVAVEGLGLEGDRYFHLPKKPPPKQVTLIESEALEAIRRDYRIEVTGLRSRRNILTEGVPLNHLVDREFLVGEARLRGIKLCEPCGTLERLTVPGVQQALTHRGGLRAEILVTGRIRAGDPVHPV